MNNNITLNFTKITWFAMSWVPALAVALGILGLYALSKDKPRCPNCSAFVSKDSSRCKKCGAPLGWG